MTNIEAIKAKEQEIAKLKEQLITEYKAKLRIKPHYQFCWSLPKDNSPLFSLMYRVSNISELILQQKQDFEAMGSSSIMLDDYPERWRGAMQYVLCEHNGQDYLVYTGGGTIFIKTDKDNFSYTLKLTLTQAALIAQGRIPYSIITEHDGRTIELCEQYTGQ